MASCPCACKKGAMWPVERDPVGWLGDPHRRDPPEDIGELDIHATAGRAPLVHLNCHAILDFGYALEHAEDLANR